MSMSVTPEEIALVGQQLAAIAGVFDPKNAAAIALLVQAGTTVNILIQKIRAQNEATAQRVWTEVSTDFRASVAAFEASAARTNGGTTNA